MLSIDLWILGDLPLSLHDPFPKQRYGWNAQKHKNGAVAEHWTEGEAAKFHRVFRDPQRHLAQRARSISWTSGRA